MGPDIGAPPEGAPVQLTSGDNPPSPRSRRAILAAALGGVAGAVATALGRPSESRAAAGDPLILGQTNFAGNSATRLNATSSGGAFWMTQYGSGSGVRGDSANGHGSVFTTAHADRYGVYAQQTAGSGGAGAAIRADGSQNPAVEASTDGPDAAAVVGLATSTLGSGHYPSGVVGQAARGDGVWGYSEYSGSADSYYGVVGETEGQVGAGVYGASYNATGTNFGVYALAYGATSRAIYAEANSSGVNYGLYAVTTSASGYGLWSQGHAHVQGDLDVSGTITGPAVASRIDHPLDPAGKYLSHAYVDSPDQKTVYDGTVTLDAEGEATVVLPDYVDALSRDPRYQLTPHGTFSPLYVKTALERGRFTIAGGSPGQVVSWQVTAKRQDRWASAHRFEAETVKPATERGRYLHPELYGQPAERGSDWPHRVVRERQGRAGSTRR